MVRSTKNITALSSLIALSAQLLLAASVSAAPAHSNSNLLRTISGEAAVKTTGAAGGARSPYPYLASNYQSTIDSDLNEKLPVEPTAADSASASAPSDSDSIDGQVSSAVPTVPESAQAGETGAAREVAKVSGTTETAETTETAVAAPEESNRSVAIANSGGKQRFSLPANDFIGGGNLLKGSVSANPANSPILQGSLQTLPEGTKVALIAQCFLNSQISQKGDQVAFRIAHDVKDGGSGRVFLPGNWIAHGFVTDAVRPGRNGVKGRVDIEIDKIVSPDGQYDLPFKCKISTADSKMLAISKLVGRDVMFATKGAIAGSILSVQMTGIGVAISTYGISVGAGAAAGATVGLTSALVRHGDIASIYPNDELRLETAEPISLPGFNPANLPSGQKKKTLEGLRLSVNKYHFEKDKFTFDKSARILFVDMSIVNNSKHAVDKRRLYVVSHKGVRYPVDFRSARHSFVVPPKGEKSGQLAFSVDSHKNKYSLILVDDKGDEFSRAPIN